LSIIPTDDFSAHFLCALGVLLFNFLAELRKFLGAENANLNQILGLRA